MAVYSIAPDRIEPLPETSFPERGIRERSDLQRLLRSGVEVVAPDVLVISEEFGEWNDSRRRIDLLGIDKNATLVVIELKRDDDGGHMELQAIRYAAMVKSMTFARATEAYRAHLTKTGQGDEAERRLLEFLDWDEPRDDDFGRDVRIVLVSADFSKELTTAVLWLNEHDLDIRCVRVKPYANGDQTIVDVQQVVPLPEAEDYLIRVREKAATVRVAARASGEDTGYWFMNTGDGSNNGRSWEDCSKYGFMLAGGGKKWMDDAKKLKVGDRLFAYLSGDGYVGCGEVVNEAVPFKDFIPTGFDRPLPALPLTAQHQPERVLDPDRWDLCVRVQWVKRLHRGEGVLRNRAHLSTLNRIRQADLVADLLRIFDPANAPD